MPPGPLGRVLIASADWNFVYRSRFLEHPRLGPLVEPLPPPLLRRQREMFSMKNCVRPTPIFDSSSGAMRSRPTSLLIRLYWLRRGRASGILAPPMLVHESGDTMTLLELGRDLVGLERGRRPTLVKKGGYWRSFDSGRPLGAPPCAQDDSVCRRRARWRVMPSSYPPRFHEAGRREIYQTRQSAIWSMERE